MKKKFGSKIEIGKRQEVMEPLPQEFQPQMIIEEITHSKEEEEMEIIQVEEKVLNINEFLSSYSQNRNLDNAVKNWARKKDPQNPKKTVEEWNQLLSEFYA